MFKKLTVGDVLDTSFKIYTRNFGKMLALSACLCFPALFLYQVVIGSQMQHFQNEMMNSVGSASEAFRSLGAFMATIFGGVAIFGLLFMFFSCAVTWATAKAYRGEPILIGACITKGLTHMPAAVGSGIVLFIISLVLAILCFFPVLLAFFFALSLPAIVIEGFGPFAAMGRSSRLVKGAFWRVFGAIAVASVLVAIIQSVVSTPLQLFIMWKSLSGGGVVDPMALGPIGIALTALVTVVSSIVAPVSVIAPAVLFMGLREEKEAAELEYKLDQLGGSATPPTGAGSAQ